MCRKKKKNIAKHAKVGASLRPDAGEMDVPEHASGPSGVLHEAKLSLISDFVST